ncbi:peptidase M15D vanX D-ala-D-ala dipeptidase [Bacteroides coprosuis DSM 18011]|uniref:D-alanyl-D-alanine dipeptidase n=1 Tax=Bacteroides coprosuis DSM 18011 TaxID=679937 RepID=F3ZR43_9BACE|nr:M15 family metallopeptidase [Bacteroides coprosuis]EGJ70636.1 peptidase M15D vanX D-ala-D-ala dipeptidase [Bacteroides coprosuis DSM 18011]
MKFRLVLFFFLATICFPIVQGKSKSALSLEKRGMINLKEEDPSIHVHLMYAYADNFVGEILYDDLKEAYLHPLAAKALIKAHQYLKELHPQYSFIVYDACRPMSVQQKMWNKVKHTTKAKYVSNPANGGGLHNYGMAVDISILDEKGKPLSMGTPVDHLGYQAHIDNEEELVKKGIISLQEKRNRELLRSVMRRAGFRALPSEWWHFNKISRAEARKNYKPIL